MNTRRTLVSLCFLTAFLQACAPIIPVEINAPFKQQTVDAIKPGITTREQVLGWFGIPMSIAAQDEKMYIKQPAYWLPGPLLRPGKIEEFQPDTFLELFSSRHRLGEQHRVYYFYHSISQGYAVVLGFYINEKIHLDIDKLWVLVNEETGLVEDYVYHPFKKNAD